MNDKPSMRRIFAESLLNQMQLDGGIYVLTADLGYGMFDQISSLYPKRFINCGTAEQAMIGMAVGLALEGKKPFTYSITPFLIGRAFEWIRNYINYERVPVRLVGSGLNDDYEHDGISHHAWDARAILQLFPNITAHFPAAADLVPGLVKTMIETDCPSFLCLRRP